MTTAKHDEILERRKDVWNRRVLGSSVREIAHELGVGVATVHSDLEAVRAELDDGNKYRAEIERNVGAGRLDIAARKLLSILTANLDAVDLTPEQLVSLSASVPSAINALAKVEERRAKLLGLDAASKTELTGADGGPLQIDARNALLSKLASLAAGEAPEAEAPADTDATES